MSKSCRDRTPTAEVAGLAALAVVALVLGCPRPAPPVLEPVPAERWPVLTDDLSSTDLEQACAASLGYLEAVPADRLFGFGPVERTAAELAAGVRRGCGILISTEEVEARRIALQAEFELFRSSGRDGRGEVLFTGYYEPLLEARREPGAGFETAIYGVPEDLVTVDLSEFGLETDPARIVGRLDRRRLVPYPDREAIDFGAGLPADAEVLGYVADPVDVFFLHVQGSGTLVFTDGSRIRAGYAATNGRPYRSIGGLLIDQGTITREAMSMQAIRGFLERNPHEIRRVLSHNPSYVFFRPLPAVGGPLGCYGQPVIGGRSIATDRRLFPAPAMAWIRATIPGPDGDRPIERFVLNHDTGGSIRGPGRVDLFFGRGDAAGDLAGRTKHLGELYFLLPKRTGEGSDAASS
jgi:membrane-bound lytic murein transglycosylase A